MLYDIGSAVVGSVISIYDHGCEVALEDGTTAGLHISEISDSFVRDVHEYLEVGQTIKAFVIGYDAKDRPMLSMKRQAPEKAVPNAVPLGRRKTNDAQSFESMMKKFRSDGDPEEKNNGRKTSKRR